MIWTYWSRNDNLIGQYYDGLEAKDGEIEDDLRKVEKPMSWADMCETTDDESVHEDKENDDEDAFLKSTNQDEETKSEEIEYRMDTPRGLSGNGTTKFSWQIRAKPSMFLTMMMMDLRTG